MLEQAPTPCEMRDTPSTSPHHRDDFFMTSRVELVHAGEALILDAGDPRIAELLNCTECPATVVGEFDVWRTGGPGGWVYHVSHAEPDWAAT